MHLPWEDRILVDGRPSISSSITPAETGRLQELAAGQRVLEVGSAWGYSAIILALGGAEHVTAIDPHEYLGSRPAMEVNLAAYNVTDRVTIVEARSQAVMPDMEPGSYGLVFIDGDHDPVQVYLDVTMALSLITDGGYLAVHDYQEDCWPGPTQVLDALYPQGPLSLTDTLYVVQK
jgi:predicted O-methyltransferase YrrM